MKNKMERLKASAGHELPFRLSDDELESLRIELQTVGPERQKIYQELQKKACGEFVRQYGDFLNEEQITHMLKNNVIIADPDKIHILRAMWDKNIEQTSRGTTLNGKQFIAYRILEPKFRRKAGQEPIPETGEEDIAIQLWAGRLALVPLLRNFENQPTSPQLLISEKEFEALHGNALEKILENAEVFVATSTWAGMALHEKIHGIQKYDLPLPLLEIVAYYYEHRTFQAASWSPRIKFGFYDAIDYWEEIVDEIGPDLHRFIFGNLPENRSEKIKNMLLKRFSPEVMRRLFNKGEVHAKIQWLTEDDLNTSPK